MSTKVTLIPWKQVMQIARKSKHHGELGWTIAKQLGLTDSEILQSNLDEKIGEKLDRLIRETVKMRITPRCVEFDTQGNVNMVI